jgi:hypothetical protein
MHTATRSLPRACVEYLITQRRLCCDRGFHQFTLSFNGKVSADDAERFLKKCPELAFNVVSQPNLGRWMIYLNKL